MFKQIVMCFHKTTVKKHALLIKKTQICAIPTHNLFFPNLKFFTTSPKLLNKLYLDHENVYAFNHVPPPAINSPFNPPPAPISTLKDFESTLTSNFRNSNIEKIIDTFQLTAGFAIDNSIPLSDARFNNLVDGLMDHCQNLTDFQLFFLLNLLKTLPQCESSTSHNFHDMWSCLDDICCWKMSQWDRQTKIDVAMLWYQLNLAKLSDYVFELINYLESKSHQLDKNQLLQLYFLINACRKKSVDFNFEHKLAKHIQSYDIDQLGIIAMAYFKSKTKIKLPEIVIELMRRVTAHADVVHDITLSSILKAVRLSQKFELVAELDAMMDSLVPQIARLSDLSCLHVALIGTTMQYCHPQSLRAATLRLLHNIEHIRLKEIERILIANAMFNFTPSESVCIYQKSLEELLKPSREPEIAQYTRCLPSALASLSLRGVYSFELMDRVLDEAYIHEIYGKSPKFLPRDLFQLDRSVEIECPGYGGNRLTADKRYRAAKWLTEYVPTRDQWKKLTLSEKYYLDVAETFAAIAGGAENVLQDHVLPHFSRPDVVLCRNRQTGEFVRPFGLENYILGDVKRAKNCREFQWICFVLLVPNIVVRGSVEPLGSVRMKERQLKMIGYDVVYIPWTEFSALADPLAKTAYLKNLLPNLTN